MTNSSLTVRHPSLDDVAKGALAGLAAGLVASFVMNQFQAIVSKLSDSDDTQDESATTKAADKISQLATGESVSHDNKQAAGNAVHYVLGGALGLAYGIAAEFRPAVTKGLGTGLSLSTFALLDEAAVPAAGLAPPPTQTPISSHLYGGASHLVFGSTTEGVRRGLRSLMQAA